MFRRLTQKKMVGGLVFGPPGWMPQRIEDTFALPLTPPTVKVPAEASAQARPGGSSGLPTMRGELIALLERIGLGATSNVIPALTEQLYELRGRPLGTLVFVALPTQPEFVWGPALTRLALPDLLSAITLMARVLQPRRILLALDRHDLTTYRFWKHALRRERSLPRIRIKLLLNRYPQAQPTMLARTLFGERLSAGALPTRLGRLMVDPVACWGLGRYLRTGEVFTTRPVQLITQDGHAPRLVMGRVGETITQFCQRYQIDPAGKQIIVNGMLTGQEVEPAVARLASDTEAVGVRDPVDSESSSACLACGWCVDVCPTELTPVHLMELAQKAPPGGTAKPALLRSGAARESLHCVGCGLCSYVCPTRLPLMQEIVRLQALVTAATRVEKTRGAA